MQNARLDEAQAVIKISGRNINNLRYTDDIRNMKKESEKVGLKLNIQKTKVIASSPITPWEIDGETMEIVTVYSLGFQNHCRW